MRILIDTHVLLWALYDTKRLSKAARELLQGRSRQLFFSAASIWEIAIKSQLGRTDFDAQPDTVLDDARESGFVELAITGAVAAAVARLQLHHRDPFDRLLVAQAVSEPVRLVTADARLAAYSDLVSVI